MMVASTHKITDSEKTCFRYYISLATVIPFLIVLATSLSGMLNEHENLGYGPRAAWCFVDKPMITRIFGYIVWYLIFSLVGVTMMAMVGWKLYRSKAMRPVAKRMFLFLAVYTAVSLMSYVQGLIQTVKWSLDGIFPGEDTIELAEFSSSLAGIGVFIVFATGHHLRKQWEPVIPRWSRQPSLAKSRRSLQTTNITMPDTPRYAVPADRLAVTHDLLGAQ